MHSLARWLGAAAAGLVLSTIMVESLLALLVMMGAGEHLLWAVTAPTVAATAAPAWLAVIWLGAATAGAALATAMAGHFSASLPIAVFPAVSLGLVAWYFRQPALVGTLLMLGPMLGCLLGMVLGRTLRRLDQREALTARTPGAGL